MGELSVSIWEEAQRRTVRMKPHEDRNTGRPGVVSWASRCSVRRMETRSIEGARVPCPLFLGRSSQVRKPSSPLHPMGCVGSGPEISE